MPCEVHCEMLRAAKSQSPAMTHHAVETDSAFGTSRERGTCRVLREVATFSCNRRTLATYELLQPTKAAFKIPWVRPEHALETLHTWNPEGFE